MREEGEAEIREDEAEDEVPAEEEDQAGQGGEGEEEEVQAGDDIMDMMEDPMGREEEMLEDPTVHPHYHDWPVSAFRRGKGPGKGRAAGRAPRFNAFGRPMQRGLYLPENMDVMNEEQLAMYARNVWRSVNPGGEASASGIARDLPQGEAQPVAEPPAEEEEEPSAVEPPFEEEPMEEDELRLDEAQSPSSAPVEYPEDEGEAPTTR